MTCHVQPVRSVKLFSFVMKLSEEDLNSSNKQVLLSWQKKNSKKWVNKSIKLENRWIHQPLSELEWNLNNKIWKEAFCNKCKLFHARIKWKNSHGNNINKISTFLKKFSTKNSKVSKKKLKKLPDKDMKKKAILNKFSVTVLIRIFLRNRVHQNFKMKKSQVMKKINNSLMKKKSKSSFWMKMKEKWRKTFGWSTIKHGSKSKMLRKKMSKEMRKRKAREKFKSSKEKISFNQLKIPS